MDARGDELRPLEGQRTPATDMSDSEDEFFDALVTSEDAALDQECTEDLRQTKHETTSAVIGDLMQPLLTGVAEGLSNAQTDERDNRPGDDAVSSDGSASGSESEEEMPERQTVIGGADLGGTGRSGETPGEAELPDGLKAEAEEEEEHVEDEEDGGLIIDEDALRELELQMTEEEKTAKRQEAQTQKANGNDLFKAGEFADAVYAYGRALQECPLSYKKDRSIMYANRAACKVKQEHLDSAIADCTKALELNPVYLKVVLRRAQAYELTDKLDDSLKDYQRALELDPGCYEARAACMRLPDQIQERNEKLKAEMMSKLKDLGNLCLRPFGLSTNNFQLNQDPSTGSYSVNFTQNPGNNGK